MGDMYVTNRLKRDNEGNVFIDKLRLHLLLNHLAGSE